MTSEPDDASAWVDRFLNLIGAPAAARHMTAADRQQLQQWLVGLDPALRSRVLDGGEDHPDVPWGAASLRYAPGQGYVQVTHLYRVHLAGIRGEAEALDVQSFLGRDKAVAMAVRAHAGRPNQWPIYKVDVDELGPTAPGGMWDAIDDRAEW